MFPAAPIPLEALPALELPGALRDLKATVLADLAEFRREVGWRLPSALESVSASEIRQYLGEFLEQTFRAWAERENTEVRRALSLIAERAITPTLESLARAEPGTGPDSRLLRPTFEVSTLALDASVVAALALGIATLLTNAAIGGLFLIAAPTLASLGRERGERALRQRAAESAMQSVDAALALLGIELTRVIDDFGRRIVPVSR